MNHPVDPVPIRQPRVFILVVGSLNMDLVARCPHIPAPGETILGSDFTRSPGGKGANGATAAARLLPARMGGRVAMLGAVGRDDHGAALVRNLGARGVDAERVLRLDGVPTGVALIAVADDGENSIVVVPGANGHLRPEHVEAGLPALSPTVVLMQMEIPPQTVERAAALGRQAGAQVLLDPAPAPATLPAGLLRNVDVLLPNEGELAMLAGMPVESVEEATQAAAALRGRGVGTVVVKRGDQGALVVDERGARAVPTLRVDVVDTTGAGDCFDGALAVALAEGRPIDEAVRFATHAAALACTRLGAQSAQPERAEVEATL
ncbi:MAG TPA: ribokinase [Chloroflexota bacterium]|nr:ribokinase [Chloroflexota bacterium]